MSILVGEATSKNINFSSHALIYAGFWNMFQTKGNPSHCSKAKSRLPEVSLISTALSLVCFCCIFESQNRLGWKKTSRITKLSLQRQVHH